MSDMQSNVNQFKAKTLSRRWRLPLQKCVGPAWPCRWINRERRTWEQHNAPFSLNIILVGIASSFIWLCREKVTAGASPKTCCGSRKIQMSTVSIFYFSTLMLFSFQWLVKIPRLHFLLCLSGQMQWNFLMAKPDQTEGLKLTAILPRCNCVASGFLQINCIVQLFSVLSREQ